MKTNIELHTNGTGCWSNESKTVKIIDIYLNYVDEDFGELHVVFDKSWNIAENGLIYTDELFLKELQQFLGISKGISYSEQGMQGNNYVSFDLGEEFFKSELPLIKSIIKEPFTKR